MIHVSQRTENDCGIATAAMIGGISYHAATAVISKFSFQKEALHAGQMKKVLEAITQTRWRLSWTCWIPKVSRFCLLDEPGALILQGDGCHHWIAITRHNVHDPALAGPVAFDQYVMSNRKVLAFLSPCWQSLLRQCNQHGVC